MVLERGRLGFVTVHHEIRDWGLSQHRPFAPGREAGTAATEERRLIDFAGDGLGEHRECFTQSVVTARREVARQGM